MAGGVLNFALGLDVGKFTGPVTQAIATTQNLKGSVASSAQAIDSTMKQLGSTAEATAAKINSVAISSKTLQGSAALASSTTKVFAGVMGQLGMVVAPQVTSQIFAISSAASGLASASSALGVSLGGLTGIVGGVVAVMGTWYELMKLVNAEMGENKAEEAFRAQYETLKGKLIPALQEAQKLGKLSPKEAVGMINRLNLADSDDARSAALKAAQRRLIGLSEEDKKKFSTNAFNEELKRFTTLGTLTGKDREKKALEFEMQDRLVELLDKSKGTNVPEKSIIDSVNKVWQSRSAEIDARYKTKDETKSAFDSFTRQPAPATSIEKMGFMFGAGGPTSLGIVNAFSGKTGASVATEHARATAANTAEIVRQVKILIQKTGSNSTPESLFQNR